MRGAASHRAVELINVIIILNLSRLLVKMERKNEHKQDIRPVLVVSTGFFHSLFLQVEPLDENQFLVKMERSQVYAQCSWFRRVFFIVYSSK